jgi:superfamily II DNA or RNA helicase
MADADEHPFAPRPHQTEALEKLAQLRDDGIQRALVVLAPGLARLSSPHTM